MISTVTTTTVSTVTTVAMAGSLGLVAVILLLTLLIQKEVVTVAIGPRAQALSRVLNIALAPLLIVFAALVLFNLAQILG